MIIPTKNNCSRIGYFLKPHGVSGILMLIFDDGLDEIVENTKVFFVETDGILVPWFTADDGVRIISSKSALVELDWITDETAAKKLTKKAVWVEKYLQHNSLNVDEIDLTGYKVFDNRNEYLGIITEINNYSGNQVITIKKDETELLFPLHHDFIADFDEIKKTIIFIVPEGLIGL